MHASYPAHLILPDLVIIIIFGEDYMYEAPHYAVLSSVLPFIPLQSKYSQIPSACVLPSFMPIQNHSKNVV
jgi:hypothetical protein